MGTASKMELGASRLVFNTVDLGHTSGGVQIGWEQTKREVKADQYGDSLLDEIVVGEGATIKCSLREHGVANLQVIFPLARTNGSSYVYLGEIPGTKLGDDAAELIIRPYASGSATTKDFTFYKAVVSEVGEMSRDNEGHAEWDVTFRAYLDTSRSEGDMLCKIATPNA
ncbi:MAG: hypothetical protein ABII76_24700 [Pseudomonadota bacterium]